MWPWWVLLAVVITIRWCGLCCTDQLQQLSSQPNGQNRADAERKLQKQKQDLDQQLSQKAQQLLQMRLVRRTTVVILLPCNLLTSDRQHPSCDDCLEDKTEDYLNCSVMYSVWQLCSHRHTHSSYRWTNTCWFQFRLRFVCICSLHALS